MIEPADIIYLDNNATTQLDPAVVEEMMPFLTRSYGNPSSGYSFGAQARDAVELARELVAALLGCTPGEVVFTSGGTESIATAITSALQTQNDRKHIVATAVEHSATLRFCERLREEGCDITLIGVNEAGELDLDALNAAIRADTALVSAMWVNNETGVIFPIAKIAAIARERGVLFHTDGVQAAGKLPLNVRNGAINFLSLSAHKIHGPKGVGALFVDRRTAFRPLLVGGEQENSRRAGTENVAAIVGFGKAAELAAAALSREAERIRTLRDWFEAEIAARVSDVSINGRDAQRVPHTSSISFRGIESDAALIMLDRYNVCCSAGSACRTGSPEPSHVLRAMGLPDERLRASLRFSFSRFTRDDQVERAIEIVTRVVRDLRALNSPPLVSVGA